jgi:hypothetical protein
MLFPRLTDYIIRLRNCGIPQRDIALLWRCRPNIVSQKLNGYLPISANEEKKLIDILEVAEAARKDEL